MFRLPTLASLFLLVLEAAHASPCIAFDANFNLLVFGLDGKDWNAGTQDTWPSGSAKDITTSGRPPFDGSNTTCYLSQFYNAVYVMNGDASQPSAVHIYNPASSSWSTQPVTTAGFNPANFDAILDHDTNVFYALSNGEMYFLDMGSLTAANSSGLTWNDVGKPSFSTDNYKPVMALAQNHIHFLDVPNVPAGSAQIFVIHFSYFQPDAQAYSGATFPAAHGQATSFFQESGVQQEFAFIPDDGSATYVINVETNTTTSFPGPSIKDAAATYFAGITSLVQLASDGTVSYLPYKQGDTQTNQAAAWGKVTSIASAAPPSSHNSTSSASGSASATKSSAGAKASSGASTNSDQSSDARVSREARIAAIAATALAALGFALL
ncbi:hypothetical protein NEOLEDRAFT_1157628 [Neolentinus lepideus HHB14362 ss-1]|uniref:Uncharacterized protein n=1 Tax=Neolentinus lepideus HHB14362 ss-1 TaxID=1314782 RepID=A0A165QRF5_9AGAM|nr:hypothetical protein NEOLEDRAFT_1157628 [Neolentinus lepideus HHB14362 ss-1]